MSLKTWAFHAALMGCLTSTTLAQFTWQSREFNQAASVEDEKAVAQYSFRNTGQQPIEILAVSSSCGCTVAKPDKTLYLPGESGPIEATFTFGSRTGEQRKTIAVRTREENGKVKTETLTMRVSIPALARMEPGFIFWRQPPATSDSAEDQRKPSTASDWPEAKTIRVTFEHNQPMRVLSADASIPTFKTSVLEIEAGKVYDIVVTPQSFTADLNAAITIRTDAPWPKWQTLQARARILGGSPTARQGNAAGQLTLPLKSGPVLGSVLGFLDWTNLKGVLYGSSTPIQC